MSEIKKIRVTDNTKSGTEKISDVQLSSGKTETVAQVVSNLESNDKYYYTTSSNSKADVEAVYPKNGRKPYIRTVANGTESDNLLSLPRF